MSAPYRDNDVYALTCTGCGGAALDVLPDERTTPTGDPLYRTTIRCHACGTALRSLLWRDDGRWYTSGQADGGAHVPAH